MDFETYQNQYVKFIKATIKTRLLGILSQEIYKDYPQNLPKSIERQMYNETLYMKRKAPKPEKFSQYTKHSLQLQFFENFNINFIHRIINDEVINIQEWNPPIKEIYTQDMLNENSLDPEMTFNELKSLLDSDSEIAQQMRLKAEKKEHLKQAWLFDHWLYYQEFTFIISLFESFLRDSYEVYLETFPEADGNENTSGNSDDICFTKLLDYFMQDKLKLVQRIGPKNIVYLRNCWKFRNAIIHNSGVVNERVLRGTKNFPYKLNEQIIIDTDFLEKFYDLLGNIQRIIYKKVRLLNEKIKG
ncbi:MAG: hypothetical protein FK734_12225 [Asgard group archaeon]|nr:hypothetical protein [Asgard group archaeon]